MDLAEGHVAALNFLAMHPGWHAINLGTGQGYSVLQVLQAFEATVGRKLPYQIVARRPGDVAQCFAKVELAEELFGWKAMRNLTEMCSSSWKWQQRCVE